MIDESSCLVVVVSRPVGVFRSVSYDAIQATYCEVLFLFLFLFLLI